MESLVKYESGVKELIESQMTEIRKFIAPNLTEGEFWIFIQTAKSLDLNPLKREIYPIKYQDRLQIITGYEVYIKRANLSKLLEWWKVEIKKPSDDFKTWIGVFTAKRLDWTQEFIWEVPMVECYKTQATWQTMKEFMLKKTTIGQGLRLLIPEVLAGMPYIAEELGSQIIESEYVEFPEEQKMEPSESEQEAKDKVKNEALEKIMVELQSVTTLKDLDTRYNKGQARRDQSELKDSIEKIYESRKKQLTIEALAEIVGFSVFQIQDYLDQLIETDGLDNIISEVLVGNKDAIEHVKADITAHFLIREKQESSQDEFDLADM